MFWKRFTLRCKWLYHHINQDILEDTLLARESCSGCPHILPTRTLCSPHPHRFHPNGQSRRWIEKLVNVFEIYVSFLIGLLIVVRLWPSSSRPARSSVKWKTAHFFCSRIVLHRWLVSSTAREALCLLYKNTLSDLWGFKTEKLWGSNFQGPFPEDFVILSSDLLWSHHSWGPGDFKTCWFNQNHINVSTFHIKLKVIL